MSVVPADADGAPNAGAVSPDDLAVAPPPSQGVPAVLIVDDNEPTARALASLLAGANFQAVVSYRGGDAIAQVERSVAGEGGGGWRFAAAVVDVHLPDLSGLVVSQKLRELLGPGTPIVVLSGDTSMPVLNSLPHVGATYFFSKPVNGAHLIERLREWIAAGDVSG